eukprot:gene6584-4744_t
MCRAVSPPARHRSTAGVSFLGPPSDAGSSSSSCLRCRGGFASATGDDATMRRPDYSRHDQRSEGKSSEPQKPLRVPVAVCRFASNSPQKAPATGSMTNRKDYDEKFKVNRYASESTSKLIVGNKTDLPNRVISTEALKSYADQLQIPFIETSAFDASNVNEAFEQITRSLLYKNSPAKAGDAAGKKAGDVAKLDKDNTAKHGKSGCC